MKAYGRHPRITPAPAPSMATSERSAFSTPSTIRSVEGIPHKNFHKLDQTLKAQVSKSPLIMANRVELESKQLRKRPAFRYKTSLGHFPKEAEAYSYVKRKDPLTKAVKIVPDMVYPIEANRIPVPLHELLEDDWRAYRCAIQNLYTIVRRQQHPMERFMEKGKMHEIVSRLLGQGRHTPELLAMMPMDSDLPRPQLAIYKDCVAAPVGYFYRHYKQRRGPPATTPAGRGTEEYKMNSVTIEDPFQSVLAVNNDERRPKVLWDADVIVGSPTSNQVYVYNQPDAIPIACVRTNFGNPLTKRVQQAASGQYWSREANSRIQIPLPHEYLTPFMPRKERPDSPKLLAMHPDQENPSDFPGVTYAATLHDM